MEHQELYDYYKKIYPEYSHKQIGQLIWYHVSTGHSA